MSSEDLSVYFIQSPSATRLQVCGTIYNRRLSFIRAKKQIVDGQNFVVLIPYVTILPMEMDDIFMKEIDVSEVRYVTIYHDSQQNDLLWESEMKLPTMLYISKGKYTQRQLVSSKDAVALYEILSLDQDSAANVSYKDSQEYVAIKDYDLLHYVFEIGGVCYLQDATKTYVLDNKQYKDIVALALNTNDESALSVSSHVAECRKNHTKNI